MRRNHADRERFEAVKRLIESASTEEFRRETERIRRDREDFARRFNNVMRKLARNEI